MGMQEPDTRRIDLTLEPLDDYVVIQPSDEESETNLGLIIPASAETDCRTGVVTAVGAETGGVEPGDKGLFPSARCGSRGRREGHAARRRSPACSECCAACNAVQLLGREHQARAALNRGKGPRLLGGGVADAGRDRGPE
jgi:hypothetical protein